MKCYSVTKDGVVPGIQFRREPYPHVAVGDPALASADYRRVEIDTAPADSAGGKGPQAETPVNLVVLKKGDEVKIHWAQTKPRARRGRRG